MHYKRLRRINKDRDRLSCAGVALEGGRADQPARVHAHNKHQLEGESHQDGRLRATHRSEEARIIILKVGLSVCHLYAFHLKAEIINIYILFVFFLNNRIK